MRLVTAALAASLLTPIAAHAQSEQATLQARIKSILEGVRAPMYNGPNVMPGFTMTFHVNGSDCQTVIEIAEPTNTRNGTLYPAMFFRYDVAWGKVTEVRSLRDATHVQIVASNLSKPTASLYAGGRGSELATTMRRLAQICGGLRPAPVPTPSPTPTPTPAPKPRPASGFTPQLVVDAFKGRNLPSGWTLRYSRLEAGVYVFTFDADLRVNPRSEHSAPGPSLFHLWACFNGKVWDYVNSGTKIRSETRFISATGTRVEAGPVIQRCGSGR
jgi:hypothetical protein